MSIWILDNDMENDMKRLPLSLILLLASGLGSSFVYAQELTPKQQYAAATKDAAARYAEDRKLCAEETESSVRLQCLRDAKAEQNKSIQLAKNNLKTASAAPALAPASRSVSNSEQAPRPVASCPDCGKVVSVTVKEKAGDSGAVGLIAGGVAGALLGRQIGGGRGKDVATLAGAAGGAFVGDKIEKSVKATKVWEVQVQYNNGSKAAFSFDKEPGFAAGDVVINSGDSIVRR
jgi:outer membrane lipoprotein SlyB